MKNFFIFLFTILLTCSTTALAKQTIIDYNNAGGSIHSNNFGSNAITLPKNSTSQPKQTQQTTQQPSENTGSYKTYYWKPDYYYNNYSTTPSVQSSDSSSNSSSSSSSGSYFQEKRAQPVTINGVTYY